MPAPTVASPLLRMVRNAISITFHQKRQVASFLCPFQEASRSTEDNHATAKESCKVFMVLEERCTEAQLAEVILESKRQYVRLLGNEGIIIFQATTLMPERGISGPFPSPSLAQVLQMRWVHVTVDPAKETTTVSCRNAQGPSSTFYFHPSSRQSVFDHLKEAKQEFEEEFGANGIRIFIRPLT